MSVHNDDPQLLLLIGRLEGKLDSLIQSTHHQSSKIVEIDSRVMRLESSKAWVLGAASVISILASFTLNHIFP